MPKTTLQSAKLRTCRRRILSPTLAAVRAAVILLVACFAHVQATILHAADQPTPEGTTSATIIQQQPHEHPASNIEHPASSTPPCLPRTDDEIWFVSTRGLGCPSCGSTPPALGVWQYDPDACRWNASSMAAFLSENVPGKPTVIWVHGNRLQAGEARSQGVSTYRQLTRGVSGEFPIRFVIFSWPAAPTKGIVQDARRKAIRTNTDGYYLASLVSQIDPNVPVNLIGYSFGARIVTGALHLLGGGVLAGRALPEPIEPRAPVQAVLLAAAVNNHWLAIGRPHGEALEGADRLLSLNNHCDRALKRYGKIDRCGRPQALGYTGAVGPLDENRTKLRQVDVYCVIGKSHHWENYFYTPSLLARMRPYVGLANDGFAVPQ